VETWRISFRTTFEPRRTCDIVLGELLRSTKSLGRASTCTEREREGPLQLVPSSSRTKGMSHGLECMRELRITNRRRKPLSYQTFPCSSSRASTCYYPRLNGSKPVILRDLDRPKVVLRVTSSGGSRVHKHSHTHKQAKKRAIKVTSCHAQNTTNPTKLSV